MSLASWPAGAVSARTAILPSLLEAVGVVLVTAWIGRRLFDAGVGVVAGLVVLTTVGVFSFAHSAMPDMALLLALTGAMAAYVRWETGGTSADLVAFYALVGIACLTKGAAGLLPLAIVLVHTLTVRGVAGLRRLGSAPGLVLLLVIAVPWWIVAATADRERFVSGIVLYDQLLWYVPTTGRHWRAISEPIMVGTIPRPLPTPIETRRLRQRFGWVGRGTRPSGRRGSKGSSTPYARRKSENASPCQSSS